jgi:hypothetical protein
LLASHGGGVVVVQTVVQLPSSVFWPVHRQAVVSSWQCVDPEILGAKHLTASPVVLSQVLLCSNQVFVISHHFHVQVPE